MFIYALFAACLLLAEGQGQAVKDFFNGVNKGLQKEISDIKQPVETSITYIASSQCSHVKRLAGVAYEQIDGEKEPDLDSLKLTFISPVYNIEYNITMAAQSIPRSMDYSSTKKLVIYIHGFTDDPYQAGFGNISQAFFSKGEYNVLALDGSSLIHWLYLRSTTYVRFMGEKMGEVLAALYDGGRDPSSIHVIGHSLGAHISGFTGKEFTRRTGKRIGRISGLDPAGPCFSHVDESLRLKSSDADFVDVIHSDAGVFGISDPVGHVDFYPNDGSQQPECFFQTCSHSRAWLYYSESVVDGLAFPAVKCADWKAFKKGDCQSDIVYMGYGATPKASGKYYLQTNGESPYGKGINGTVYENQDGIVKSVANLVG